ncbi:MAG: site-specific integrase [Chthoniobacter sp.]|uniref:site-specific integrase n=1 Tax=Chthoniobacter sp. TaxID=2510640 RepID=UPI0032A2B442
MPRQSGLLCRNGRFYLNMRVPTALRAAYGRTDIIRKSLNTSDRREAVSRVRYEAFRQEAEFAAKSREIEARKRSAPTVTPKLLEIESREAHEIVTRFFVRLEKESEEWLAERESGLTEEGREVMMEDLYFYSGAFAGKQRGANPDEFDGARELDCFIEEEGLEIPKDSAAYRKLRPLFHQALLENALRNVARAHHDPIRNRVPFFREVFSYSSLPERRQRMTLGEMLSSYLEWVSGHRANVTRRSYELPARLLREVLGEKKALDSITKRDTEDLFALLKRAPANATQRYPRMTLQQAIEAADKAGDSRRLGTKTLGNYYTNISAIFNYAVAKKLMAENPAKDRYLRETFASERKQPRKKIFTAEELNRLFRSPLYCGCQDDGFGFATPGPNKPRRGRFWVPLLSLFHGLRCNEAAQLYTEDICEDDGISFFEIREERADGSKCDKKLKTEQSKRRIPIHPAIIRIGFLDYVAERRKDSARPRLFPDLPCGKSTGYFSDPFSKFFSRFVELAVGDECKATFHSFRHHFRDALREAGVSIDDAEALGGWSEGRRSAERDYGHGPSLKRLREQIAKVKYGGLDLSHLFRGKATQPVAPSEVKCRVRTRRG